MCQKAENLPHVLGVLLRGSHEGLQYFVLAMPWVGAVSSLKH